METESDPAGFLLHNFIYITITSLDCLSTLTSYHTTYV